MNYDVSRVFRSTDMLTWIPLGEGKLLLNVNATINNGDVSFGIGMVLRDYRGEVKFSKANFWPFPVSAEVVEAFAVCGVFKQLLKRLSLAL